MKGIHDKLLLFKRTRVIEWILYDERRRKKFWNSKLNF